MPRDLSTFHRHMEYDRSTMIWAGRQSGKSFALCRKFVENRDSVMFVPRTPMRRTIDDILVDLGCPDRRRNVYIMQPNVGDILRGRQSGGIFIDEIDNYSGNLEYFLESTMPAITHGNRLIAVSTPSRIQEAGLYDRFFPNNLHLDDRVRFTVPRQHFDEELFTI
jgi:hypothetical protein